VSCCDHDCRPAETGAHYRQILWVALGPNTAMFLIEIVASVTAGSVSLRADALDFLGDAANYAVALAVVGLALHWRAKATLLKGSVMGTFGLWVAGSTIYNVFAATVPKAEVMGAIGLLALAINLAVAGLLYRYRGADSQALSVWLCTRNDCVANIAVMLAGVGVWMSATGWPDIAMAAIIACLGLSSAARVIRQALREMRSPGAVFTRDDDRAAAFLPAGGSPGAVHSGRFGRDSARLGFPDAPTDALTAGGPAAHQWPPSPSRGDWA
jgi:Co/Zn/Cd efflux system component